jgi:hypothetical protein
MIGGAHRSGESEQEEMGFVGSALAGHGAVDRVAQDLLGGARLGQRRIRDRQVRPRILDDRF